MTQRIPDAALTAAEQTVLLQYQPLIWKLARRVFESAAAARLYELEDLVQHATFTVVRALRQYDPTNDTEACFLTYLHSALWHELCRFVSRGGLILVPGYSTRELAAWDQSGNAMSRQRAAAARRARLVKPFPESPQHPGERWEPADPRGESPELVEFPDGVRRGLACLKDRDRYILWETVAQQRTLAELAAELGITKERVRQIKERALRHVRKVMMNGVTGAKLREAMKEGGVLQ